MSVEVMRGCTQGCRFLSGGLLVPPHSGVGSHRRHATDFRDAEKTPGNREVGLLSLSTADYSQVECLTREMSRSFSRDKVSISLPSLRADALLRLTGRECRESQKKRVHLCPGSFAPEAGSIRLRQFVNKNISNEELFQAIETAYRQGWKPDQALLHDRVCPARPRRISGRPWI